MNYEQITLLKDINLELKETHCICTIVSFRWWVKTGSVWVTAHLLLRRCSCQCSGYCSMLGMKPVTSTCKTYAPTLCIIFIVLLCGPHLTVLGDYPWLCNQGLFLVVPGLLAIKLVLAACESNLPLCYCSFLDSVLLKKIITYSFKSATFIFFIYNLCMLKI